MMKGQIQEELNNVDNAREAYKQGVSVEEIRSLFRYVGEDIIVIHRIYAWLFSCLHIWDYKIGNRSMRGIGLNIWHDFDTHPQPKIFENSPNDVRRSHEHLLFCQTFQRFPKEIWGCLGSWQTPPQTQTPGT